MWWDIPTLSHDDNSTSNSTSTGTGTGTGARNIDSDCGSSDIDYFHSTCTGNNNGAEFFDLFLDDYAARDAGSNNIDNIAGSESGCDFTGRHIDGDNSGLHRRKKLQLD